MAGLGQAKLAFELGRFDAVNVVDASPIGMAAAAGFAVSATVLVAPLVGVVTAGGLGQRVVVGKVTRVVATVGFRTRTVTVGCRSLSVEVGVSEALVLV